MKKHLLFLFAILSAIVLAGCSSAKHAVEIAEHSVHDTLYLTNIQYDSIYVSQEHDRDYHRGNLKLSETAEGLKLIETVDTIFIKDVATQFKYKYLHDTTYVHKVDTIPVIKTVTEIQQVKYIPSIYKWSLGICITLIVLLVLYLLRKLKLLNL